MRLGLFLFCFKGGRFPETLNAKDKNGRTPLHYAATIPDNGHYFNVLLNLGADRKVKDNVSCIWRRTKNKNICEMLIWNFDF